MTIIVFHPAESTPEEIAAREKKAIMASLRRSWKFKKNNPTIESNINWDEWSGE